MVLSRGSNIEFVTTLRAEDFSLNSWFEVVEVLPGSHVHVQPVGEPTTNASGELIFNIFAALAQFERELIRERTKAELSAARVRGKLGGRKPLSPSDRKILMAKKLHADKTVSIHDICKNLNISKATLYRYLAVKEQKKILIIVNNSQDRIE